MQEPSKAASDDSEKSLRSVGWYWGKISPKYAEELLADEDDGAFIVRDSSSAYHLFSFTFKYNGQTHHARIEHEYGSFFFFRSAKFRAVSIIEFIEQVIEFSNTGTSTFFLHRDPSREGPVKLKLRPVSGYKKGSLKQMCR